MQSLVQAVARTFYRDEHAVILDRLSREVLVRDDDLPHVFGLPHRQLRTALAELVDERAVCAEEVTERLRSKRDARLDVETQLANLKEAARDPRAAERKRKRRRGRGGAGRGLGGDSDEEGDASEKGGDGKSGSRAEDADESSSDEGSSSSGASAGGPSGAAFLRPSDRAAAAAAAEKKRRRRARRKVKTVCYFINPRFFTDAVKYRLLLMRKHLEDLSLVREGSETVYWCANAQCAYKCTLLEAEERRQSLIALRRNAALTRTGVGIFRGAGVGGAAGIVALGGVGTAAPSSQTAALPSSSSSSVALPSSTSALIASEYEYSCPVCGSLLTARLVENVAAAASRLLVKFQDQMRQANIFALVKSLETVPLGANRPSDAIKAGLITLHGQTVIDARLPAEGNSSQGAHQRESVRHDSQPSTSATGNARVYVKSQKNVHVMVEAEGAAAMSAAKDVVVGTVYGAHADGLSVSATNLPAFLTRSTKTGEATREFGFVAIRAEDVQSQAGTASKESKTGESASSFVAPASESSNDVDVLTAVDSDLNAVQREAVGAAGSTVMDQQPADADLWSLVWQSLAGADEGGGAIAGKGGEGEREDSIRKGAGADFVRTPGVGEAQEVGGAADEWEDA